MKPIPSITPAFVAKALGLPLPTANAQTPFSTVTTDSRKIRPGCLFVAIKGDRLDGHDFIGAALSQGATGIIHQDGVTLPAPTGKSAFFFPVKDTLTAYRQLGAAWRREFHIPVIAVAGSVGKTTTKEFLAAIFLGKWKEVLKTQASQNGFIGIPMTLLELNTSAEHATEAAVIEVGIDEIGAMDQHMEVVAPTAALVTTICAEHLEKLRDIRTVAHEEGLALKHVSDSGGLVAINLDDPWLRPYASQLKKGKVVTYSFDPSLQASVTAAFNPDDNTLVCSGLGLKNIVFQVPLPGRHNAMNLLAAITLATAQGMSSEEIKKGLKTFRGADGRSEVRELPGPTPVLCDYYNANPTSTEAGLELLSQIARKAKSTTRWACLGDMLELGPDEELFHRNLAGKLIELGIEHVLLYGPRMRMLYAELTTRSFRGSTGHFTTHAELASELIAKAKPGDTILIKGSRGMKMEEVWKILEKHGQSHWQNPHSN